MKYQFPVIRHIDDVLPAIKDRDEFVVAERDGYTVINYNVMFNDTFGHVEDGVLDPIYAMRGECRGIIFDSVTGNIIRRPWSKFFNINEKPETQSHLIDMSKQHIIYDKLDGSMIAPFYVDGQMIWGTKMGNTDVAQPVNEYVINNSNYCIFANSLISLGYTPIFEWCSRKQRIVLDYGNEDQLILVGVRHVETGEYLDYHYISEQAARFDIPVVKIFDSRNNIHEFIEYTRGLENVEGFVIDFDSYRAKLKCDWYVQIHKAKEAILQDRNIVEMIMDEHLDDIKAHLHVEDRDRLDEFESKFNKTRYNLWLNLYYDTKSYKEICKDDRKTFALNHAKDVNQFSKAGVFFLWDDCTRERAQEYVTRYIRSNIGKNINWNQVAEELFFGLKFN